MTDEDDYMSFLLIIENPSSAMLWDSATAFSPCPAAAGAACGSLTVTKVPCMHSVDNSEFKFCVTSARSQLYYYSVDNYFLQPETNLRNVKTGGVHEMIGGSTT